MTNMWHVGLTTLSKPSQMLNPRDDLLLYHKISPSWHDRSSSFHRREESNRQKAQKKDKVIMTSRSEQGKGGGGNLTITLTAKTPSGRSSLQDSNRDTNIDISLGVQHHYLFIKFLSPFSKYFSRREQRPALSLFISFTLQTFKLTKNSRKNSALNLKSKLL